MNRFIVLALYLTVGIFLAACGGGDDGGGDTGGGGGTVPSIPQNVQPTFSDLQNILTWSSVTGATSYNIYWNTVGSVTTSDNKIANVSSPHAHTGLTNGTMYYYIVTAVNATGESMPSTEVSATPQLSIPITPQNVQAATGDGQLTVSWDAVNNATSYNIYWNTTGSVTTADNQIIGATSPYDDTGLTNGTTYYYIVTAVNASGESLVSNEVSATPNVYTVYFVSSSAIDDSGDGLSPGTAKQTITAAIAAASAPGEVRVNAGNYSVNSDITGTRTHVVVSEGISLYGGYNADFSTRDSATNITSIIDTSATITQNSTSVNAAIEVGAGVSAATIIDGFNIIGSRLSPTIKTTAIWVHDGGAPTVQNNTLDGGYGGPAYGMYISSSSPTVQNNTIKGGRRLYNDGSYGMYIAGSSPTVQNNTITSGNGNRVFGIYNNNSSPIIQNNSISCDIGSFGTTGMQNLNSSPIVKNNIISAGTSTGSVSPAIGMNNTASSPIVLNNIISGGSGNRTYGIINTSTLAGPGIIVRNNIINGGSGTTFSYGVYSGGSDPSGVYNDGIAPSPTLDNNIIFTSGSNTTVCLYEDYFGEPTSARNNDLFSCMTLYRDVDAACTGDGDGDGDATTCTLTEMQALTDFGALGVSGNVSADPVFVELIGPDNDINDFGDNDWHFSASSPTSVTAGGLNGEDSGGWGFTVDKDGITRPGTGTNWSIGAYEP